MKIRAPPPPFPMTIPIAPSAFYHFPRPANCHCRPCVRVCVPTGLHTVKPNVALPAVYGSMCNYPSIISGTFGKPNAALLSFSSGTAPIAGSVGPYECVRDRTKEGQRVDGMGWAVCGNSTGALCVQETDIHHTRYDKPTNK